MKKSHDIKITSFNRPLTREQAEEIIKNNPPAPHLEPTEDGDEYERVAYQSLLEETKKVNKDA